MNLTYYKIPESTPPNEQLDKRNKVKLVVVAASVDEVQRLLLTKILESTKLDMVREIRTLTPAQAAIQGGGILLANYPGASIICFDNSLSKVFPQLDGELYIIKNVKGRKIVGADSLKDLSADKKKKIALWESLKNMIH